MSLSITNFSTSEDEFLKPKQLKLITLICLLAIGLKTVDKIHVKYHSGEQLMLLIVVVSVIILVIGVVPLAPSPLVMF
jgi:uncharacterized membrane protein YcjF (UPF0283 family)